MHDLLLIIISTIASIVILKGYIHLASRKGINDKPNSRSSHDYAPVRGAGIIFPPAIIAGFVLAGQPLPSWFLTGLIALAIISFWDDVKGLPAMARLPVHVIAAILLSTQLVINTSPIHVAIILVILTVIFINGFNFMDGINGITGLYSIAVLLSLMLVNQLIVNFTANIVLYLTIAALLAFGYFNFRQKATCFAGDVGSITIAFFITYMVSKLVVATGSYYYLLFISVYTIDFGITILHRLKRGEKIWQPHRLHLYQILVNEKKKPHLVVASSYATLQLSVNAGLIFITLLDKSSSTISYLYALLLFAALTAIYLMLRHAYFKNDQLR